MPYHIERVAGGWKVVGPEGPKSKAPLSHEGAMAQMRALYANVPDARPQRTTHVKPLQMQKRQKNDNDADDKPVGRARGGKVNLSGKQKKSKTPPAMPPIPAAASAAPPMPMGAGGPMMPPGQNPPGFKDGGKVDFIKKAVPASRKGVFKAKAKAAGKTTAEYASEESGAPGKLGAEARLAQTLMHLRSKK